MVSTKFHLILAKRFSKRTFKCERLTDDGAHVMTKSSCGLWPDELKSD